MSLVFSVPGKTFLAGEYLALKGGPTMVFLSQPCFELEVSTGEQDLGGIHENSPAGLYIQKNRALFSSVQLRFHDAYQGLGGFGASTAQFLAVYAFGRGHQKGDVCLDISDLLKTYYECAWSGVGQRPSGADLVGQYKGYLTFFEKRTESLQVRDWPFQDIEFYLFHTGNKVPTHEHLKSLQEFNIQGLEAAFHFFEAALKESRSDLFVEGVRRYGQELQHLGFTCPETLDILNYLQRHSEVLAAKGCGALGADVVLVVTKKSAAVDVIEYAVKKGLKILTSSNEISTGLRVRGEL